LSDPTEAVEVWQAPFFEQPQPVPAQASVEELAAMAQARGFQLGKEEGLAAGRAEAEHIASTMRAIADQMARPYENVEAVVTRELAELAIRLTEQIVRRELVIDSSVVTHIAEEAIAALYKLEGEIVIFVNPADAQLLREFSPEALEGKSWKISEDPAMSPGGCQIKTPSSFVDASVERQVDVVITALLESCEQASDS